MSLAHFSALTFASASSLDENFVDGHFKPFAWKFVEIYTAFDSFFKKKYQPLLIPFLWHPAKHSRNRAGTPGTTGEPNCIIMSTSSDPTPQLRLTCPNWCCKRHQDASVGFGGEAYFCALSVLL